MTNYSSLSTINIYIQARILLHLIYLYISISIFLFFSSKRAETKRYAINTKVLLRNLTLKREVMTSDAEREEKMAFFVPFFLRNKRKANKRKDEYMTIRNSFGRPARSISLMVGIKLERHLWERNPILPFPRTEWSSFESNSVRMPVSFRRKWKENPCLK